MGLQDFIHPIKRLKETIGLYDNLVYTHMVQDDTADVVKMPAGDDKVAIDQMGIYQGNNVTFLFLLEHLPNFLHIDFKTRNLYKQDYTAQDCMELAGNAV